MQRALPLKSYYCALEIASSRGVEKNAKKGVMVSRSPMFCTKGSQMAVRGRAQRERAQGGRLKMEGGR